MTNCSETFDGNSPIVAGVPPTIRGNQMGFPSASKCGCLYSGIPASSGDGGGGVVANGGRASIEDGGDGVVANGGRELTESNGIGSVTLVELFSHGGDASGG